MRWQQMLECFGQESVPPSTVEIELQQNWVYTFGQYEIEVCPTGVFNTINGSTSRGISLMVKHQKGSFKCRQTPLLWILKTLGPNKRPKRLVTTSIVLIEEAGFILVRTTYHFLLVPPIKPAKSFEKNLGFTPKKCPKIPMLGVWKPSIQVSSKPLFWSDFHLSMPQKDPVSIMQRFLNSSFAYFNATFAASLTRANPGVSPKRRWNELLF